jgi:predicted O-methyltransferase YrrM
MEPFHMIDVTYGNVSQELADRMVHAANTFSPDFPAGATEPWITELVCSLLKATGIPHALETGAFLGHSTARLAETIEMMGGGSLLACEIDVARYNDLRPMAGEFPCLDLRHADALSVIATLPDHSLGLAWVDDDHTMDHVSNEVAALWPKMAPRGLICLHDVIGSCDLRKVVAAYGGTVLDFPRCGPAGGLGIIQPLR